MQQGSTSPWAGLLPDTVVLRASCRDPDDPLPDVERRLIADAVPARQREFGTGRILARAALGALAEREQADAALAARDGGARALAAAPVIGRHRSGAPRWPDGVVGSITHAPTVRAAAVARRTDHTGIGIDAMPSRPLPRGVLDAVATPEEVAAADALPLGPGESPDSVLFSAKESVAKAVCSAGAAWPGLDGVTVLLRTDGTFTTSATDAVGRWAVVGGVTVTAIVLGRGPRGNHERNEDED